MGGVAGQHTTDVVESARPPREPAAVPRRRRSTLRRLVGAAAVVGTVVAAVAVVAGRPTHRPEGPSSSSATARGPSHPSVRLAPVAGGWYVVGRVDGFGTQVRMSTVQWPDGAQVALLVRCPGGPAQVRINFAGREPVAPTACTADGTLVSSADMPALVVPGGEPVTVRATNQTAGSGAWVVAVLTRVPFSPWSGSS
jgi:hypothetical protein